MVPWWWLFIEPAILVALVFLIGWVWIVVDEMHYRRVPMEEASEANAEAIENELRD